MTTFLEITIEQIKDAFDLEMSFYVGTTFCVLTTTTNTIARALCQAFEFREEMIKEFQ